MLSDNFSEQDTLKPRQSNFQSGFKTFCFPHKATEAFLDGVYGTWIVSLLALSSEDGVVSSGAH